MKKITIIVTLSLIGSMTYAILETDLNVLEIKINKSALDTRKKTDLLGQLASARLFLAEPDGQEIATTLVADIAKQIPPPLPTRPASPSIYVTASRITNTIKGQRAAMATRRLPGHPCTAVDLQAAEEILAGINPDTLGRADIERFVDRGIDKYVAARAAIAKQVGRAPELFACYELDQYYPTITKQPTPKTLFTSSRDLAQAFENIATTQGRDRLCGIYTAGNESQTICYDNGTWTLIDSHRQTNEDVGASVVTFPSTTAFTDFVTKDFRFRLAAGRERSSASLAFYKATKQVAGPAAAPIVPPAASSSGGLTPQPAAATQLATDLKALFAEMARAGLTNK